MYPEAKGLYPVLIITTCMHFYVFTASKVTDVFVTIGLGKEKFQTSTIKYGGKVSNSVEWFEECDL